MNLVSTDGSRRSAWNPFEGSTRRHIGWDSPDMLRIYDPLGIRSVDRKVLHNRIANDQVPYSRMSGTFGQPLDIDHQIPVGSSPDVAASPELVQSVLAAIGQMAGFSGHSGDSRTGGPGVNAPEVPSPPAEPVAPVYLADLLNDYYKRDKGRKTDSSWSGYRTLVRKWKTYHGGDGPDVRSINAERLQRYFEGVPEWKSHRSWERNRDLLYKLLKTGCLKTLQNKEGADAPVLVIDELPVWELPTTRWFRDRDTSTTPTRKGGHRKRKLELLTVDEFGKVLEACNVATWKAPEWWQAWFSLLWFCGPRYEDSFRYCWNSGDLHISRDRQLIDFTETKCGGSSGVPLPSALRDRLEKLWSPERDGKPIFTDRKSSTLLSTRSDIANRSRHFSPEYHAIWEAAGVELRHPHELRSVCISNWLKHSPKYRFAVTGHSTKGDIQMTNYVILDAEFRDACETYPWPVPGAPAGVGVDGGKT